MTAEVVNELGGVERAENEVVAGSAQAPIQALATIQSPMAASTRSLVEVREQRVVRARDTRSAPVRMAHPRDEPPAPVRRHHPVRRAVLARAAAGEPARPPRCTRAIVSRDLGREPGGAAAMKQRIGQHRARRPPGRATSPLRSIPVSSEKRGQTRDSTRPSASSGAGTPSAPSGGASAMTPRSPSG